MHDAKITTAFAKVGGSGDFGGSYFLAKLVGAAKARELYFLSDVISGAEAHQLGIVNASVSADDFDAEVRRFSERLANSSPVAIGYMKKNLNAALRGSSLSEILDLESMHMSRCLMTEDHKAAARAFVEKRLPVFEGR